MTTQLVVSVTAWLLIGMAAGLWMTRRGHDPRWVYLGALLGPLFVPVAVERVRTDPGAVPGPAPGPHGDTLRVLVGYDGSPEAEEALRIARRLAEGRAAELLVAEVVPFEAGEDAEGPELARVHARLAELERESLGTPLRGHVLSGPPAASLCAFAQGQDVDLLVVGSRGRGLTRQLVGHIAERVVQKATVPVVVARPVGRAVTHEDPGLVGPGLR